MFPCGGVCCAATVVTLELEKIKHCSGKRCGLCEHRGGRVVIEETSRLGTSPIDCRSPLCQQRAPLYITVAEGSPVYISH